MPNNAVGIKGTVEVDYDCSHDISGDPNVLDPVVIEVHVGNDCFAYPTFDPATATFGVAPCFTEKIFTFTIQPKKSILSLDVDAGTLGNCGEVTFNASVSSDGANATDVFLDMTPPPGYALDPAQCKMGPGLSVAIPPAMLTAGILDVSSILLTPFNQNYFTFESTLTAPAYNPLAFRLVYRPGCNTVPGVQDFQFSLTGKGTCTTNDYVSYVVTVCPGDNLLGKNLCRGENNIVEELTPFVSDGDTVRTYNETTQTYNDPAIFLFGDWYDGIGNPIAELTVSPGKGYFFHYSGPTSLNISFAGCEPTNCSFPCLPTNGCVLVGRLGLGTAMWGDLSDCPPKCVRLSTFNPITQLLVNYDYLNGGWTPQAPMLGIGQGAFVCPLDPTNCCTNAQSFVVNGSFEATSPVMSPNTVNNTLDPATGVPGWTTAVTNSFEVWCNPFGSIPASEGTNHLEINSQSFDETVSQVSDQPEYKLSGDILL